LAAGMDFLAEPKRCGLALGKGVGHRR
jgi:hypothetical protein